MLYIHEQPEWLLHVPMSWTCPAFDSDTPDFSGKALLCNAVGFRNKNSILRPQNLDWMSDDILGENLEYRGHHWNSVIHESVKGHIYNVSSPLIGAQSNMANILNGTKLYTTALFDLEKSANYLWVTPWAYNNRYGRRMMSVITFIYRFYPKLNGRDDIVMLYHRQDTFWEFDDGISVNPYSFLPTSLEDLSYSCYRMTFDNDVIVKRYLYKGQASIAITGDYHQNAARIRESLDLLAHNDLYYWNGRNRALMEHGTTQPISSLKRPDFNSLFPENERNTNWRALASEAYSSLGMSDVNGIAYLSDLIASGSEVKRFTSTLRSLPNSKVKAAASLWLAGHYGLRLALLDTKNLALTLQKQSRRRSSLSKIQSAETEVLNGKKYVRRYQVFYNQFDKVESILFQLAYLSDALLTSENVWDLIPFSFVIDWFVQVGDVLQSLDNYASLIQDHTVLAAGRSIKGTCYLSADDLGVGNCFCDCSASYYHRRYERTAYPPSLLPSPNNPFQHLVEGAMLVISRR